MEQDIDQRITQTLQAIDQNLVLAHDIASEFHSYIKNYKGNVNDIHQALQVWSSFLDSFAEKIGNMNVPSSSRKKKSGSTNMLDSISGIVTPSMEEAPLRRFNDSSISSLPSPPATTPFYGKITSKKYNRSESRNISFDTPRDTIGSVVTPGGGEVTPVINDSFQDIYERRDTPKYFEQSQRKNKLTPKSDSRRLSSEPPTPEAPMLSGTYSDEERENESVLANEVSIVKSAVKTPVSHSAFRLTRSAAKKAASQVLETPGPLSPPPEVASSLMVTPSDNKSSDVVIESSRKKSLRSSTKKVFVQDNFRLDKFPRVFQTGDGAKKITSLYQAVISKRNGLLSVTEIKKMVPAVGPEMMQLLLDTLVSRCYIEAVNMDGSVFYRGS